MNKNKKWCLLFMGETLFFLTVIILLTVIVDPFFHYHKPLASIQYQITNERYQNDGIIKHFDYDAIITGTSMTENFKTSEFTLNNSSNSEVLKFSVCDVPVIIAS